MADVIEICSSGDESDPIAKISSKLKLLKNLTVRDVPQSQENVSSKGFSPKRIENGMPMILNTVSLASTDNIQPPKRPIRQAGIKKIPVNLPTGITVKSVPKRKIPPSPDKIIFRTSNGRPANVPKKDTEMINNRTLKSNNYLNSRDQNSASLKVTPNLGQNVSVVRRVGNQPPTRKFPTRSKTSINNWITNKSATLPLKRKAANASVSVELPTQQKCPTLTITLPKREKSQLTERLQNTMPRREKRKLIERLKNNKNIVMKPSSKKDSGKENSTNNLKPQLSIIGVVNLDDSDNESKENDADPLNSESHGVNKSALNEIYEIDCDSHESQSIMPDDSAALATLIKPAQTPNTRRRRTTNKSKVAEGNRTPKKGYQSNDIQTDTIICLDTPMKNCGDIQTPGVTTSNNKPPFSLDCDMEVVNDTTYADIIGHNLSSNISLASGMSEGECIGIDDNDIQIIEINDTRPDKPINQKINIALAIPNVRPLAERPGRAGSKRKQNQTSEQPEVQAIKRVSTTLVSKETELIKQAMPVDDNEPERMVVDESPNEVVANHAPPIVEAVKVENVPQSVQAQVSPETHTSNEREFVYSSIYEQFIGMCLQLDQSDDMKKIVEKKVKAYYRLVDQRYVTSLVFEKLVTDNMLLMRQSPDYKHLYIKNIVDELKAKRKMRYGDKPGSVDVDADDDTKTSAKRWVSEKHIEKLEKALNKLHKAIKLLEEKEVNLDEDDDSVYLITERYKARAVRVYEKLCSLRGIRSQQQNPAVPCLRRGDLGSGPGVSALTTMLLKGGFYAFPDYRDVLECIKTDVAKLKQPWSETKMEDEAQKLFFACGEKLQRARQANAWAGAYSIISFKPDPAVDDSELREKLKTNVTLQNKKEEDIINQFAEQQLALRLEPEPVDDGGQIHTEDADGVSLVPAVADSPPPSNVELIADDDSIPAEDAMMASAQIPIKLMSKLQTERSVPGTSSESQDLLRIVGYDYIPFNMSNGCKVSPDG